MSIRAFVAVPALASALLLGGCGTYLHAHRYDDGMHPAGMRQAGMQHRGMEGCGMHGGGMQHGAGMQHDGMQGCGGGMAMSRDGAGMPPMMERMCAMHREMTAGKTPAAQQAAIEEHVRAMHGSADAQMVEQHKRMMARCPNADAAAK